MIRDIGAETITKTVARLFQEANFDLGEDVLDSLGRALEAEESPLGRDVLEQILENARIAKEERIPLCQDCGTAVVFLEVGQDVHITGENLYAAIEEGVRKGYEEGFLRKSIVTRPFSSRTNTNDNTPPVIHTRITDGDRLRIRVMPKGGGSENTIHLAMLKPSEGRRGIVEFVVRVVEEVGGNPCPPTIVGIGIGGTAEKAMTMAKEALLRKVGEPNPEPEVAELEAEILKRVNDLGIGPQGLGGRITALAVHAEVFPTHIASLPVAVNLQCHSARHKEAVL